MGTRTPSWPIRWPRIRSEGEATMSDSDHYLAVFTSDKNGPRWQA